MRYADKRRANFRKKKKHDRDLRAHGGRAKGRADRKPRASATDDPFSHAHDARFARGGRSHFDDGGDASPSSPPPQSQPAVPDFLRDNSQPEQLYEPAPVYSTAPTGEPVELDEDANAPQAHVPEDLPPELQEFMRKNIIGDDANYSTQAEKVYHGMLPNLDSLPPEEYQKQLPHGELPADEKVDLNKMFGDLFSKAAKQRSQQPSHESRGGDVHVHVHHHEGEKHLHVHHHHER